MGKILKERYLKNTVNFERNAEFEITGIDEKPNIPVVYLNEI